MLHMHPNLRGLRMKYSGPIIVAAMAALGSTAQADLFFSEYVEGSSLNKGVEIYNGTGSTVDLDGIYTIEAYHNGSLAPTYSIELAGAIADGDVHVIANPSASFASDQSSGGISFNGDDAMVLLNNGVVIDSFGTVGVDPGSAWTGGGVSAQNKTLRRKAGITQGDMDPFDVFNPSLEWDQFNQDDFSGLGNYGDIVEPPVMLAKIHEVQGAGTSTPLGGQTVTIEAIVIGDFQNNAEDDQGDLRGFYLQEENADADSDPMTSEGIFIYDNNGDVDVSVGDKVQVTGVAAEYFDMTQISAGTVTVISSGGPMPTAQAINLPVAALDDFEAFEGMLVTFPQGLVISEYYNFDRYGEIVLAQPLNGEQRPMTPTAVERPGSAEYQARAEANLLSRIKLDDGRTSQNPDPAYHPNGMVFDLSNLFRGGDLVQDATGVLDYRFGEYKLQPTVGATYIPANPRPMVPFMDSELKLASFNVLNYFTTLDDGNNDICGPNENLECRGADSVEEFERQRAKIVQALYELDADIVGLIEIENNDTASLDDLVAGVNALAGADTYAKIDTGFIGDDAIKVTFIYKPASVITLGDYAILNESVDPRFIDSKNRPALAQTFMSKQSAGRFTVVVNHLKSKGSSCASLGDPDVGDGQANCNITRTNAALALVDWMASNPTGKGDGDYLIMGDLNSYDKEDPIAAIVDAGYTDLLARDEGEFGYTYVFDGQFGYLDHALANTSMAEQANAAVWHINADEPDLIDYDMSYKKDAQDELYSPDAFRSSDHDPVLIGLNLDASLKDILKFAGIAINEGSLYGIGRKPGLKKRIFIKILKQANRFELRGKQHATCVMAEIAQGFSDGDRRPRDLVEGEAALSVSAMLANYQQQNCNH